MSGYDNNLKGVLFKNDQKRDGKQDADYRGSCEIDGTEYYIDSWINSSKKDGSKYMSLRFKVKEPRQPVRKPTDKIVEQAAQPDFDDAIPF